MEEGLKSSASCALCTGGRKDDLLLLVDGDPVARQPRGRRAACKIHHPAASILSAGCGHPAARRVVLLLQVKPSSSCRWMQVGTVDVGWWPPAHGVDGEAGGGRRCVASKGTQGGRCGVGDGLTLRWAEVARPRWHCRSRRPAIASREETTGDARSRVGGGSGIRWT